MNYFRIDIDDVVLTEAVQRAVAHFVKNDESFTAYMLTQALRQDAGPSINVKHDKVRDLVHDTMWHLVNAGFYEKDVNHKLPNGKGQTATLYKPNKVWAAVSPTPANIQNLSPTVPQTLDIPNIRVNSTCVSGIAYKGDTQKGVLTVRLAGGAYNYKEVPFTIYQQFIKADSKGKFYSSQIRNLYDSEKVV